MQNEIVREDREEDWKGRLKERIVGDFEGKAGAALKGR